MALFRRSKFKASKIVAGDKIVTLRARSVAGKQAGSAVERNRKIEPYVYEKDRRPLPRSFVQVFVLAVLFTGLAVFLLGTPYFVVKNVTVEGADSVPEVEIKELLPKGRNIFLVNSGQVEAKLRERYPEIKEIVVYKGLPQTLKVVLAERQPVLVWQSGGQSYLVDDQGIAYQTTSGSSDLVLVVDPLNIQVKMGERVAPVRFIDFLLKVTQKLKEEAHLNIASVQLRETNFDLDVVADQGFHIYFDTGRSPEKQVSALVKILAEKRDLVHEYVDLRVSGLAFVK